MATYQTIYGACDAKMEDYDYLRLTEDELRLIRSVDKQVGSVRVTHPEKT